MKKIFTLVAVLMTGVGLNLKAQSPVVAISTTYVATTSAVNSYTTTPAPASGTFNSCVASNFSYSYNNGSANSLKLLKVTANSFDYFIINPATSGVKLRRVNNAVVTGNRTIISMESSSTSQGCPSNKLIDLKNPYNDVMEAFLDNNFLNQGTDNIFTNNGNSDGNNNNIERVDVLFTKVFTAFIPAELGFAIFDRGKNQQHDGFRIAAVLSINAAGDPASYGPLVTCVAGGSGSNGSWGHPNSGNGGNVNMNQFVLRKDPADSYLKASAAVSQQVGGVFFTLEELGVPVGGKIYGYSLFALDGLANPTNAQLLNINNALMYPTNTTETDGGLDLMAISALFSTGSRPLAISDELEGKISNDQIVLNWSVQNLSVGTKVDLEKSTDSRNFNSIYSIPSTNTGIAGTFTERNTSGSLYYRLKMTTATGMTTYSNTVSLKTGMKSKLKIYPTVLQPNQTMMVEGLKDDVYKVMFVSTDGRQQPAELVIKNGMGMLKQPTTTRGTYFLGFTGKDQQQYNGRIVIQ